MNNRPLFATLCLSVIVLIANDGSQKGKLTNFEVFSSQIDSLAGTISSVLNEDRIHSVSLRTGSRDVDRFVHQKLLESLLRRKFEVLTDSIGPTALRVFVPVVEVSYSAPVSSHIFGSADVMRTVKTDCDVEISDSSRVGFAKAFSITYRDTVSESDIPDLEAGSYPFLRGRIESKGLLDTVIQPVLFVASAAVVVYLFFTLRGS